MTTRSLRLIAAMLLMFFWALPADAQSLEGKVTEYTLENGLKLLLYERHQTPIIACRVYVDVGSANDELGETGIAHMTEHIAFKGTKTLGTTNYEQEKLVLQQIDELWNEIMREQAKGDEADQEKLKRLHEKFARLQEEASQYVVSEEYSRIIEENGGVGLNASTSLDSTEYYVSLPANRLELWMMLEADRLVNTVPREFYKERDVIMEERRMRTESSPIGTLVEQFVGTAFIAHPYGFPTLGWMSDIQAITPAQLMEFYDTYYVADNMTISIVGDIDPQETIRLAEKYFGGLPKRPAPLDIQTVEPPQPGERRITIEWDANPYVLVGYHRPSVRHEDDLVFDVIAFILSGGRTSRLHKQLVEEQKIAIQAGAAATYPADKYPTLFLLVGVPLAPHTVEEVEQAMYAEIERLKTEPLEARELEKVINNVEAGFINSLSSNSGMTAQLAFADVILGDWQAIEQQIERIKQITPEDVMRVAKQYFTEQNRTVAWLIKQ